VGENLSPQQFSRFSEHVIDPGNQERLTRAREAAPDFQNSAIPAYTAYRDQTRRQFDHLTAPKRRGGIGLNVDVTPHDPYGGTGPAASKMMSDVRDNNHLSVLSTKSTGGHPWLSDDDNDMFRAVHDYHGHYESGRGFDLVGGEENAYQAHAKMYSPLAQEALATETRSQTSYQARREGFPRQIVATFGASAPLNQITVPHRAALAMRAAMKHKEQGLAL
jgi:hypothetical protein